MRRRRALAIEEVLDGIQEGVLRPVPGHVIGAGQLHELRSGNVLSQVVAALDRDQAIAGGVCDESRRLNRRQDAPHVESHVHLVPVGELRARQRLLLVLGGPPAEARLAGHRRCHLRGREAPSSPERKGHSDVQPPCALRRQPRVVIAAGETRVCALQHQRLSSLRICRREERGQRSTFRSPHDRGALDLLGVHHRNEVLNSVLQRRRWHPPIGHAGSALVELDHARERPEALEEPHGERLLPDQLDVLREARDGNDGSRTASEALIGDRSAGGLRIVDPRRRHRGPR